MTMLNDKRLELLVQQEQERISESQPSEIDLQIIQARSLCWLVRLAERHENQAMAAEKRKDTEQAMGWYADAHRLRDVINIITSIEIPFQYEDEIELEDQECLSPSMIEENNIIYETLDYTHGGIKDSRKRRQIENLQIQKKIDIISEKSNNIEEQIKINNEKLDQINLKLIENKVKGELKHIVYIYDKEELMLEIKDLDDLFESEVFKSLDNDLKENLVYKLCIKWANKSYNSLKKNIHNTNL